jgi:mycofactocin glycosyltransferase
VIPFSYSLRPGVRLEEAGDGTWRVVSTLPLAAMRINAAAATLLEHTRGGISVSDLACALALSDERCVGLCEQFRRRGILELAPAPVPDRTPSVSVIVPTMDRAGELAQCLAALARLDYPRECLEVLVVDDGSRDAAGVASAAAAAGARLVVNERNRGPAHARNHASCEASGELLAFLDSDCLAEPGWLAALVPYFSWDRVGAVGGRTAGWSHDSRLARYEEVSSALDMGPRLAFAGAGPAGLYAPTCNLLVRRAVFCDLGGLREELRVGEDVDFCWRLRDSGRVLVYTPEGVVHHRHRQRLGATLRRRADYGSSEPVLHALHPDKAGRFGLPPASAATVALVAVGVTTRRPWLLAAALVPPAVDAWRRRRGLRGAGVSVPVAQVAAATARGHGSALYFAAFHAVRYHLGLLALAGAVAPGIWLLGALAILCAGGVDCARRKPRLSFPEFLGYYVAEHASYQAGVLAGRADMAVRGAPRARASSTPAFAEVSPRT